MRKNLLATSALAALGVVAFAGAAAAQSKPTISLGGYAQQWFGYVWQQNFGNTAAAPVDRTGFATVEDMEVHFNGRVQMDNGVVAGMRVELEGATSGDQIDESWMFVSGSFGRFQIGAFNNVAYTMSYFSPKAGVGVNEVEAYTFVQRPGGSWAGGAADLTGTARLAFDNDSNKIAYYTPRISGFQVGASFAPKLQQDNDGTGDGKQYRNSWAVAANYDNKFSSGLHLAGNVGYAQAEAPLTPTGVGSLPDIKGWNAGLNVGYGGFLIGGEYQRMMQGAYVTSSIGGGTTPANQAFNVNSSRGHTYDVGVKYDFGPANIGVQYIHGEAAGAENPALSGNIKSDVYMFGADYDLGPGVMLTGSLFYAEYKGDNPAVSTDDNKGTGLVGGVRINF